MPKCPVMRINCFNLIYKTTHAFSACECEASMCSHAYTFFYQAVHLSLTVIVAGLQRFSKPILVLVNPASGRCQAGKLIAESTAPLLDDAGVDYKIVFTGTRSCALLLLLFLSYGVVLVCNYLYTV